jgi:hypothetical protein
MLAGGEASFEQGLGSPERAWFARYTHTGESEGLERSAGAARWAAPSVPARNCLDRTR